MFFAVAWPLAAEQPLLEGQVRLRSGEPVANAQVAIFDLANLRPGVVAYATTDAAGYFALPISTRPGSALPQQFTLGQNYPNPFNPSTVIPYQLASAAHVRLEIFNVLGQRLATLVDGVRPAGSHTAQWDATDAAGQAVGAGVYIYRLSSEGQVQSRRMVLIDGQAGVAGMGAVPERQLSADAEDEAPVYGLAVAGVGLVAYVDTEFRVGAGMGPVEVVVEAVGQEPRGKVTADEILGDVNNDGRVDLADVLLVMMYSLDPSINIPNIARGDMNNDGRVELIDAYLMVNHILGQSDSSSLDPSAPVNLSNHFRNDWAPDWSPDGSQIAFVSDRDGNAEIYVMDADGSNPTRLTNNNANDESPVWSPDGTHIAFVSDRDVSREIYVIDANGGDPTRFTYNRRRTFFGNESIPDDDWDPAWSPDSRRIAWVDSEERGVDRGLIYAKNLDGSDEEQITRSYYGWDPAWSPDGRRIAFVANCDIVVSNADGRNHTVLSDASRCDIQSARSPVWSPNGRRIAFYFYGPDPNFDIYAVDADGGNGIRLTDNAADDEAPVWSPNGLRLAFHSDREGNFDIYVMDADGDNVTRLTDNAADDESSVWSPDGSQIAFVSFRDGNREIYVIDVD